MSSSALELDQEDITGRLEADSYFVSSTPVLQQRKGITEDDVQIAMQTVQPGTKCGTVVIVLMPKMIPEARDAAGPRYWVRYAVQVIDYPLYRRQTGIGTGVSAEAICDRVRQILHRFSPGRGQTIYFDGLEPVPVKEGQVSYVVYFRCLGADSPPTQCATCGISPASGAGPLTVTLTNSTSGASIYYTTDGSYPSAQNATATLYSAPFTAAAAALVRAVASKASYQDGNAAQVQYT
jgi:hypothetical protein